MAKITRRKIDEGRTKAVDLEAEAEDREARPEAGAEAEAEAGAGSVAPSLVIDEEPIDEGKRARVLASKKKYRDKKRAKAEASEVGAAQQAALLLSIVSTTAVSLVGPVGAMTEGERLLILEPLSRMIERLPAATREAVDRYSDPISLIFGLAVYGTRVYRSLADQAKIEGPSVPYPVGYEEPKTEAAPEAVSAEPDRSGPLVSQSPEVAQDLERLTGGDL